MEPAANPVQPSAPAVPQVASPVAPVAAPAAPATAPAQPPAGAVATPGKGVVRVLRDLVLKVQFDEDMPEVNEIIEVDNPKKTPLLVSSLEKGDIAVCLNISADRSVFKNQT